MFRGLPVPVQVGHAAGAWSRTCAELLLVLVYTIVAFVAASFFFFQFLVFLGGCGEKDVLTPNYLKAHVDFVLANRLGYTRVAKCNARFSVIKRCAKAGTRQRSFNAR